MSAYEESIKKLEGLKCLVCNGCGGDRDRICPSCNGSGFASPPEGAGWVVTGPHGRIIHLSEIDGWAVHQVIFNVKAQ